MIHICLRRRGGQTQKDRGPPNRIQFEKPHAASSAADGNEKTMDCFSFGHFHERRIFLAVLGESFLSYSLAKGPDEFFSRFPPSRRSSSGAQMRRAAMSQRISAENPLKMSNIEFNPQPTALTPPKRRKEKCAFCSFHFYFASISVERRPEKCFRSRTEKAYRCGRGQREAKTHNERDLCQRQSAFAFLRCTLLESVAITRRPMRAFSVNWMRCGRTMFVRETNLFRNRSARLKRNHTAATEHLITSNATIEIIKICDRRRARHECLSCARRRFAREQMSRI